MVSRRASGTECKPRKGSSQGKLPPRLLPSTAKTGRCSGQLLSPHFARQRRGSNFYTVYFAECGSEPCRKPHSKKNLAHPTITSKLSHLANSDMMRVISQSA